MNTFVMVFIALSSLYIGPATAQVESSMEPKEGKIMILPAGKVINKDYFAYGERVEISGTVNGDVYAAGGQILVDGKINGDLLAAGGKVNIAGTVSQDVRIAGGQITINGKIGRNLTVAGGNVELTHPATIRGGIVAAGGSISLAAPVGKDMKVAARNLTVSNKINGSLHAAAGDIRLTSKAVVTGDLSYWSGKTASIDEGAKVGGVVTQKIPGEVFKHSSEKMWGFVAGLILFLKTISFISTLILGLLFIYFFPSYSRSVVSTISNKPLASLGSGFLVFTLTPSVVLFLLITVVGIPLALILSAAYFIGLYLVRIFAILWVGITLFERFGKKVRSGWALVIGLLIYSLLTLIPVIGAIVALFVMLFGLGAALLADRELYLAARAKEMI